MSEQQLGPSPASIQRELWPSVLRILALLAVVGAGILLAHVLLSPEWTKAVSVIGLGALIMVLLASPRAGILLWLLLAPFASYIYLEFDLGSGLPDLDATRLAVLFLALLLLTQRFLAAGKLSLHPTWMDAAVVACAGAMLLSGSSSHLGVVRGVQAVFDIIIVPLLAYYFARRWLRSERDLMSLVGVVALVGVLLGLITAREQLTGYALFSPVPYGVPYESGIRKVLSVFASPAIMAITLAVGLPLLLYGIQKASSLNLRLLLGLALIVTLAGVFFTYVRAGWLGALLGLLLVIALSPGARRAVLPLLPFVALAVFALVTLAIVSPQVVQGRLTSEQSISYRLTAWRISWEIFRQSPLLGIGLDNFGWTAETSFGWSPHGQVLVSPTPSPHSTFLNVLVSAGLLGFVPYLAIFAAVALRGLAYWKKLPRYRELVAVLWATLLAYLVLSGSFDALFAGFASILFFVIAGAVLGFLDEVERQRGSAASPEEASP